MDLFRRTLCDRLINDIVGSRCIDLMAPVARLTLKCCSFERQVMLRLDAKGFVIQMYFAISPESLYEVFVHSVVLERD